MKISIATLFRELYQPFLATSLVGRAQQQGHVSFEVSSLFDYAPPKTRVDAPVYGHGMGMLIRPEIVEKAVEHHERLHGPAYKIFFSPHGKQLNQDLLKEIYRAIQARGGHVMVLPARYEGMDARVESYYADQIISVGDFVLMGGDLPAMMLIEGLLRLVPGVVGKQESVAEDSFEGAFVDYPHYTTPATWKEMSVPDVVRSGNHEELAKWRLRQAVDRSVLDHFDWTRAHDLSEAQQELVLDTLPSHYAVLMHSDIRLFDGREGTTSVTSLDIHDIARSMTTYGLRGYFIVTPLIDQQKIIQRLLDFWSSEVGGSYNKSRQEALTNVVVASTLDEVLACIKEREAKEPLLMATSAHPEEYAQHEHAVTYHDQGVVWRQARPVVFVFGTGHGLSSPLIGRCDYMLPPLHGFARFNHLSVRSAAAIVFDRWLGSNIKK